MSAVEGNIQVNGKDYQCECTYDGDSQYNVQVRNGKKVVANYKISAGSEGEVLESARAHFAADVELGNVQG
ncbi:hypothetical protein ABE205_02095 [Brevibacillus agri]|uniref:hypothetical protein n=1 Tax=Brevibacillus agri TaxID=51101 RepID=UPI0018CDCDCE|nr:hypothetical protein [Brevibacillus agri]MBG9565856.1 hypothetical protein [Brevibacillus agri]WHX28513.1 hypothetical protein QNK09_15445 [Brevibacillus agri]